MWQLVGPNVYVELREVNACTMYCKNVSVVSFYVQYVNRCNGFNNVKRIDQNRCWLRYIRNKITTVSPSLNNSALKPEKFVCNPLINSIGVLFHGQGIPRCTNVLQVCTRGIRQYSLGIVHAHYELFNMLILMHRCMTQGTIVDLASLDTCCRMNIPASIYG